MGRVAVMPVLSVLSRGVDLVPDGLRGTHSRILTVNGSGRYLGVLVPSGYW